MQFEQTDKTAQALQEEAQLLEEFGDLFHRIAVGTMAKKNWYFKGSDSIRALSLSEAKVLDTVCKNPGVNMGEVSCHFSITKSAFTFMINRLEEQGYLRREISTKDRRSYALVPTEAGRQLHQEHLYAERILFQAILDEVGTLEEKKVFVKLLARAVNSEVLFRDLER